jgi:4-hydroxy-3-methylbut-2-enyl diphosphate reductase
MVWGQLKHPSEIFQIGQKINVSILSFDKAKKKVSLGFKKQEDDPWFDIESFVKAEDEIEVKVVRIVPFGAFAEVKPGVEGLIHISNISHKRVGHPAEILRIDDIVKVKVLEVDKNAKRIALSIKELLPMESDPEIVKTPDEEIEKSEHNEDMKVSLGDVIDFNIKE